MNEVPKLAKLAAEQAIKEWGQPVSKLAHLIFCTTSGFAMPSFNCELSNILDLAPTIKCFMLFHQGCHGRGTTLRLAKDLAENNPSARVLAAIFGDGASAAFVGTDPELAAENPLFEIISANQKLVPDSSGAIASNVDLTGFMVHLSCDVPNLTSENAEICLEEALAPLGISDRNSIFWALHPRGAAILNSIEAKLKIPKERLVASRNVLANYGNMQSATAMIVLDEMRKQSVETKKRQLGKGSSGEYF